MNNINSKKSGPIRVADITHAQLSRGLYRSTATAFKELVSNAYDADATVVRIDTNYPEFDFISCVDNGMGMSLKEFKRYFSEVGIGSCIKRKKQRDKTEKYKRPIIGKLGIGMLAIGQLCHSFEIESHSKNEEGKGEAFRANIILEDTEIPDKEEVMRNEDIETKEMQVGEWELEIIDYDESKEGFRIYSSDIRYTFRNEMKSSLEKKEYLKLTYRLDEIHKEFFNKLKKSIRDCKPYLETVWELAILCPLPYYGNINKFPIDFTTFKSDSIESKDFIQARNFIEGIQKKLISNAFRVIFDGIELRRHIQLPTEKDVIPKLYFIKFDKEIADANLKFSGYVFAQVSNAIKPLELNGIQIRLRNVGIGGYDSTFLKYYKQIETIRSKWVTGELFVEAGLESALNIDRDSFNEHDEHYKELQNFLHEKLDTIFDEINTISRKTSDEKRIYKDIRLKENFKKIISEQSGGKYKLYEKELDKNAPIVIVDENKMEIVLNTSSRPLKKKKADMIIRSIMLAYHTAKSITKTEKERDEKFLELAKEILDELV